MKGAIEFVRQRITANEDENAMEANGLPANGNVARFRLLVVYFRGLLPAIRDM